MTEFEKFLQGLNDDHQADKFSERIRSNNVPVIVAPQRAMGALGSARRARETLYWNAGRPSGPYVFSRR